VARTKKTDLTDSIVVLTTHVGEDLVIRANPSDEEVRGFVQEHTRRYLAGEAGGPSGIPPFRIFAANRFASEFSWVSGDDSVGGVEIADLLP
jgi:hypothetical protein